MYNVTYSPMNDTVYGSLVRFLVQRQITCPITDRVLDMDTAVVFVDADGDPALVYHESTRAAFESKPDVLESLRAKGFTMVDADHAPLYR